MRVLVSTSAFKGTLGPIEAASAISAGISRAWPESDMLLCPVADGGDGTLQVLTDALAGTTVWVDVTDPLGRPIKAAYCWIDDGTVVVELASASGLSLVTPAELDPMGATTFGTGELVAASLERIPRRMLVAVGGSATSDAGAGICQALGVALDDAIGEPIERGAKGLTNLSLIHAEGLRPRLASVQIMVACDVSNPLLGPEGAARVFAPQKGATPEQVIEIERGLQRFDVVVESEFGISLGSMARAGAAGGAAGGMHAVLGAELLDGFDVVAELLGFDEKLKHADVLIVGEGCLDEQSLKGKASISAARRARDLGVPVVAFAGSIQLAPEVLHREGIVDAAALVDEMGDAALTDPANSLRKVASLAAKRFSP